MKLRPVFGRLRRHRQRGMFAAALALASVAPRQVWAAPPAQGEQAPITITTRVTPQEPRIGDRMDLRVIAAYPRGYAVNLPTGFEFGEFHVIDSESSEPESGGQGFRKTFHIYFQTFETGPQETPSFELTYVDPDGQVQTVAVPSHAFEVRALLENEVDPQRRGEDDPVSLEYPNERAELAIYVGSGALAGSLLLWWAIARWRRRERDAYVPPPVPAHVTAFGALDALEARREEMIEHGEFPEYYVELTRILKGYVEGRFGVEALDRTTDELRRALSNPTLAAKLRGLEPDALIRFLQTCDLIKFARFAPAPAETEAALHEVRAIVETTREREAEPVAESEASETNTEAPAENQEDAA